ncbi:hypothetical protein OHS59_05880 [Streptomyces sp. NBC_00414]|uniref:hypothetical protein n=1 Tax=Streptomyces sp. NBC_00414 TaxID=2975739 RepID=UPI002E2319A8
MKVEVQPDVRESAARLGADAPYALKALTGQLADDPDMGRPSGLPGILTVTVDGAMFDDCPDLSVGYIREPDRIEIRFLEAVPSTEPSTGIPEQKQGQRQRQRQEQQQQGQAQGVELGRGSVEDRPGDPVLTAVTVREVADAWQRITTWLKHNAPDSYAALRPGADPAAVAALEQDLGIPVPVELRVLWMLTAGDDGADGWGCLPGNRALMNFDQVVACYRLKTDSQAHQHSLNAGRPEEERITVWEATRIPVIALGPADTTMGLYLDTATGFLGRWSRYDEAPDEVLDTLVTYLEEAADMLEAPALAARDKPGLIGGTLVWLDSVGSEQKDQWRPLTG